MKPIDRFFVTINTAAQQSVQWTVGILRHFRAFSTPEQNPALGVLSHPAPPPLTQTVRQPKSKTQIRLWFVSFVLSQNSEKQIRLCVWSNLFSGGICRFFFLIHFGSGFQIVGFSNLVLSFQFSFLLLVKVLVNFRFWLIGFSFGQVTLAQILFFKFIRGWFL